MNAETEALPVELIEPAKLIPYEQNAKKHPEEQINRLAAHIKRFGWDQPIVTDADGVIIKGHGRRLAALKLGLKKVPVIVHRALSKAEADAMRIADNAVVSTAYDTATLADELKRIMQEADDLDFSVDDLGLSAKDQDLLLKQVDVASADALIENTLAEIEAQKDEEREHVSSADAELIPLGDAFGFKRIARQHARLVQRLMAHSEDVSGKQGLDAFVGWLQDAAGSGAF